MSLLLSVNKVSRTLGSKALFDELSFGIFERQKVGLLGPNGAGKSTLLKMLAGIEDPDEGDISVKKGVRVALVRQREDFDGSLSVMNCMVSSLSKAGMDPQEALVQGAIQLGVIGFDDLEQKVSALSGGWKKRLSLAIAFAMDPDLLIMDEPTNHMDWDGILRLEKHLKSYKKAFVLVSHDRNFLDNLCDRTIEINRLYRQGYLSFDCGYRKFLERKAEYVQAQVALQDSMSNKARREVEWLRAGVKARTTKSQSRIKEAHALLEDLSVVKSRNSAAQSKVRVEIDAAGKRSKKMIELKNVDVGYEDTVLIKDLNLLLGPKTCLGLLGDNGSGKTSFLKAIMGAADNYSGDLFKAEGLKVVYFDQKRESLPQDETLVGFLGDGADSVLFKGESVHVASYASRFLFGSDQLMFQIRRLSGGEQARLLIAKLLLQPADVLILDEPTNDLDIDSIEMLEASLRHFTGLVLLVSHDRSFLSNLCHQYMALDGHGGWQMYPDLEQWLSHRNDPVKEVTKAVGNRKSKSLGTSKIKLAYKEKMRIDTIEQDILDAEAELEDRQQTLEAPDVFSNREKMAEAVESLRVQQSVVDDLYQIWEKIEAFKNQS